jgi:hypothetical protein
MTTDGQLEEFVVRRIVARRDTLVIVTNSANGRWHAVENPPKHREAGLTNCYEVWRRIRSIASTATP